VIALVILGETPIFPASFRARRIALPLAGEGFLHAASVADERVLQLVFGEAGVRAQLRHRVGALALAGKAPAHALPVAFVERVVGAQAGAPAFLQVATAFALAGQRFVQTLSLTDVQIIF
jgi:hypothetical protein